MSGGHGLVRTLAGVGDGVGRGRPLSKRVPREIADAQSDAMRAAGIYYIFDDTDMRKGRAMIIGPADTPYAACPLVFEIQLSDDYPFKPPAVRFLTSDGVTRFHPNLYVCGKVCLSILGTWKGPEWSAIMTISTVLSSIQSLLEANPITNEPGWEKYGLDDPRAAGYAGWVQWRLAALSLQHLAIWKRERRVPAVWEGFEEVLDERGEELWGRLMGLATERAAAGEVTYSDIPYGMGGRTAWRAIPVQPSASLQQDTPR